MPTHRCQVVKSKYIKAKRLSLKMHPDFNEKWVQALIAEDPTILGLGDLVLRDRSGSSRGPAASICCSRTGRPNADTK